MKKFIKPIAPVLNRALAISLLTTALAWATPSTTFWAPSTTSVQPLLVPHVTYDTYFWKGAAPAPGSNSPIYPVTTGLTMGVLPWEKLQAEVGFDALLPSDNPLLFNAKLGTPEGTFFQNSPSFSFGMFGAGTKSDVTDYNVLYAMVGKQLPLVGTAQVGAYYGLNPKLLTSSDGDVKRSGVLASLTFPDINIGRPWLNKITPCWDIQTGKNVLGATGGGISFYFTPSISLLTGPVYFFDHDLQPGGGRWMWSLQLDVDLNLLSQN